jgi:hypothetical protein
VFEQPFSFAENRMFLRLPMQQHAQFTQRGHKMADHPGVEKSIFRQFCTDLLETRHSYGDSRRRYRSLREFRVSRVAFTKAAPVGGMCAVTPQNIAAREKTRLLISQNRQHGKKQYGQR